MKRLAAVFLLLLAVPLFAEERDRTPRRTLVDDVIRMSTSGVDEQAIVDFVRKSDSRDEVTADDLIALTDAKVSKNVIRAVIEQADERDGTRSRGSRETRERVVYRPYYASSYWGWDPWYYDPFWYGPRLSVGFGWGSPYYGRGFYRGGGFHRRGRRH